MMRKQIEQWMTFHALFLLLASFVFFYVNSIEIFATIAAISFLLLYTIKIKQVGFSFLGQAANLVTSFRLLLLFLLILFHDQISNGLIVLIGLVFLLTDWMDGWLARKNQTESEFGTYLDMETDAFFVLVMAILLFQNGITGWWILSVGLLRYIYFLAIKPFKPVKKKEERVFIARLIAVILMSSLIAGFALPVWISRPLIIFAMILVFLSFGRSFWVILKYNFQS